MGHVPGCWYQLVERSLAWPQRVGEYERGGHSRSSSGHECLGRLQKKGNMVE